MIPTRRIATALTLGALTATVACAGATHGDENAALLTSSGEAAAPAHMPGRIVAAELSRVEGVTALGAVRQLRPDFLHSSSRQKSIAGPPPATSVYENERYAGGLDVLSLIPMRVVLEIRRVEAVEAKSRFGTSCPCDGGVILVRTQP